MKKIIIYLAFIFLLVSVANAEKYFVLDVNYILGSVTFNSINLREIDRNVQHDKSGFSIKAISFNNKEIGAIHYNMSESKNYLIYVPYDKDTARIEVYNLQNSKIMDIDVSSFADTCGNNICEEHESYESCTKDCSSGSADDFCDGLSDGICDADCPLKTDTDCTEETNQTVSASKVEKPQQRKILAAPALDKETNYIIWALPIAGIIVLVLIFFIVKKMKESRVVDKLKQYISENIRRGYNLQQIKEVLFREGYTDKEINKAIKSM